VFYDALEEIAKYAMVILVWFLFRPMQ
jgi:hypothetical protein